MYLSAIEIVGFKTFADKTQLALKPGISGLVGPNGCGKSNLADAILWAMGEQSSKTLRSKNMEDVIFNGSEARKPIGCAEVSLTFTDVERALPPPYSAYSQVSLRRCLYRSGECDYFINNAQARLKDIREFLIDAGAGYHAYNIIEQGKVEALLTASASQLREMVEEVAGIAKYRLRKAEALRKMEATAQNLVRLNDIVAEVKRQMQSLHRQARKAETYTQLKSELKTLELHVAASEWQDLQLVLRKKHREEEALAATLAGQQAQCAHLETEQTSIRLALTETEQKIRHIQGQIYEKEKEIQRDEGTLATWRAQQQQWRETGERTAREIVHIQTTQVAHVDEDADLEARQIKMEDELAKQQRCLQTEEERGARMRADCEQQRIQLEQNRQHLFDRAHHLSEAKNRLIYLERRRSDLVRQQEQSDAEQRDAGARKETLALQRMQLVTQIAETERQQATQASVYQTATQQLQDVQAALNAYQDQRAVLKESHTKSAALLSSREEFYRRRFPLLEQVSSDPQHDPRKIVADIIEVPIAYEVAMEAVLGMKLRGNIVESHTQIASEVARLSERGQGRGVFVLHHPSKVPIPQPDDAAREDVMGHAINLVTYPKDYEAMVAMLLDGVVLVKDFDAAQRQWVEAPLLTYVTLRGEVIEPAGIVSAGTSEESGVLDLKREMKVLAQQCDHLQREMEQVNAAGSQTEIQRRQFQTEVDNAAQQMRLLEMQKLSQQKDGETLEATLSQVEKMLQTFAWERAQQAQETVECDQAYAQETEQIAQYTAQHAETETIVRARQEALTVAEAAWHTAREETAQIKMSVATLEETRRHLRERRAGIMQAQTDLSAQLDEKIALQEALRQKDHAAAAEQRSVTEALTHKVAERQVGVGRLKEIESVHADGLERLKRIEPDLILRRKERDETQQALQTIAQTCFEAHINCQKLKENLFERYQVDIACMADTQAIPAMPAEEETSLEMASVEQGDVGVSQPIDSATIDSATGERLLQLRKKLADIGPIYSGAIEEYRELETRDQFLCTQQEDLTQSMASLKETITKINATTRGLFIETLYHLNTKFQEVFSTFFHGGRAELALSDPDQPLESGIEMVAEPPGKNARGVNLLSGGEKALTAIALLFAMFLIRPGPFCLLDEVDAALDEENTRRFAQALSQMADRLQLIVITHNKRTMETAHVLHGVTMEEVGISKLVSVNLRTIVTSANGDGSAGTS